MKRILNGDFESVFVIFLAIVITASAVFWVFDNIPAAKVFKASVATEVVSFEKSQPSFKADLESSKLSQFVCARHGDGYYVTVDLTAKTVNIKATIGFLVKKSVEANLDLTMGKIDFVNSTTDNEAYNMLSKIHSTNMYSIYDELFGVSVLYESKIKLEKETGTYFVPSGSNIPQFTFKDKKLIELLTDDYKVEGITY